jgi:hypothetical protein
VVTNKANIVGEIAKAKERSPPRTLTERDMQVRWQEGQRSRKKNCKSTIKGGQCIRERKIGGRRIWSN